MYNETIITAYSAMLEFYSSRAEAHASFFIAILFGLFTIFSIVNSEDCPNKWWNIVFWILFVAGLYTLGNFNYYASHAHSMYLEIRIRANIHEEMKSIISSLIKDDELLKMMNLIRKILYGCRPLLLIIGYLSIIILSYQITFKKISVFSSLIKFIKKIDC